MTFLSKVYSEEVCCICDGIGKHIYHHCLACVTKHYEHRIRWASEYATCSSCGGTGKVKRKDQEKEER